MRKKTQASSTPGGVRFNLDARCVPNAPAVPMREVFREVFGVTKLSDAVQFMIEGLREEHKRGQLVIDMGHFATVMLPEDLALEGTTPVCVGCAATAALNRLLPRPFTWDDRNSAVFYKTLAAGNCRLESAITGIENWYDNVRRGCPVDLETWDCPLTASTYRERSALTTARWQTDLKEYESWVKQLRSQGL